MVVTSRTLPKSRPAELLKVNVSVTIYMQTLRSKDGFSPQDNVLSYTLRNQVCFPTGQANFLSNEIAEGYLCEDTTGTKIETLPSLYPTAFGTHTQKRRSSFFSANHSDEKCTPT